MRKTNIAFVVLAVVVCVGWIATQSRSQQQGQQGGSTPAMTPEQQKQMEAMMKLGEPGPEHAALKPMAGKFNAECSMVMQPGSPPQISKGTSENELIYGGRYLKQRFQGEWMNQPFEGIGLTGYDNFKKKYVGIWTDSMSTMIMVSEGTGDSSGKTITLMSEMPDPATGKMAKARTVVKVDSNDKHTFQMFTPGPDGKEMNCMTIVYTRAK